MKSTSTNTSMIKKRVPQELSDIFLSALKLMNCENINVAVNSDDFMTLDITYVEPVTTIA